MKKLLLLTVALFATLSLTAAPSAKVMGYPSPKKGKGAIIGALVTFAEVGNKDNKFQRLVNEDGFTIVVPYGDYEMSIEAEGYETYTLNIDVDTNEIELGTIRVLTLEQAHDRDYKRGKSK